MLKLLVTFAEPFLHPNSYLPPAGRTMLTAAALRVCCLPRALLRCRACGEHRLPAIGVCLWGCEMSGHRGAQQ
jgi:hypothetical protein